jgi:hypothetical protein
VERAEKVLTDGIKRFLEYAVKLKRKRPKFLTR